jgi:hypothetical protein
MKLSSQGEKLLKNFEGVRLAAYRDVAGNWTIGYGSTHYHDGRSVKRGDKMFLSKLCSIRAAHLVISAGSVNCPQLSASFNSVKIAGSLARSQLFTSSSMLPGMKISAAGESTNVLMFSVTSTPIWMAVFSSDGMPSNNV